MGGDGPAAPGARRGRTDGAPGGGGSDGPRLTSPRSGRSLLLRSEGLRGARATAGRRPRGPVNLNVAYTGTTHEISSHGLNRNFNTALDYPPPLFSPFSMPFPPPFFFLSLFIYFLFLLYFILIYFC